jgi:hypothetical protein
MDEFEQALNHVYTPPTESRSPRHIPLMSEVYATLLLHIRDRAEKPVAPGDSYGTLFDSLQQYEDEMRRELEKHQAVSWQEAEDRLYALDKTQFVKTKSP